MISMRPMVSRPLALLGLAGLALAASCSSGESTLDIGSDTTPAPTTPAPVSTQPGETTLPPATTVAPTTTAAPLADLPDCPTAALDAAAGPVAITFWHAMTSSDLQKPLEDLVARYNASQDRVRVSVQVQGGYLETFDKYLDSAPGDRPDLVQLSEVSVGLMADSGTVVPVEACVQDEGYALDDYLQRPLDAYSTKGVQWSMPFNVSNPVLVYNRKAFAAAGLDPDSPPLTLDELRAASETLVSSGVVKYGISLDHGVDSGGGWFLEQWLAKSGALYSNNDNGRTAPSTEVLFDGPQAVELLTYLQQLVRDGLAVDVGENASGTDHLLKIADATQPAAMTVATSASIGPVLVALGGGLIPGFTRDDVGIAPMPGPTVNPGVLVGGASLWMVDGKGDERTAAAWDFVKFLTAPEQQSTWAAATGYVPIRRSAVDLDPIATTYRDDPRFKVAYDQLLATVDDPSANGPVLGPLREIRSVTAQAVADILRGADVATRLGEAADRADSLIADYLRRLGG
jgi:sn-glycerol 3-phosphate transport system substrate-binding protein